MTFIPIFEDKCGIVAQVQLWVNGPEAEVPQGLRKQNRYYIGGSQLRELRSMTVLHVANVTKLKGVYIL